MTRSPTLGEVINDGVESMLESVHTAIPGVVTRSDASRKVADVKPLIKHAYEDEDGNRQIEPLPVVTNCPVQFPSGGGFCFLYPIRPGDVGILLFSQSSLDRWISGNGNEVDPGSDHRHNISDGMFIPGIRSKGSPLSTNPGSAIFIGSDGVSSQGVGLGADIRSKLIDIISAINGIAPGSVTPITDPNAFESQTVKTTS